MHFTRNSLVLLGALSCAYAQESSDSLSFLRPPRGLEDLFRQDSNYSSALTYSSQKLGISAGYLHNWLISHPDRQYLLRPQMQEFQDQKAQEWLYSPTRTFFFGFGIPLAAVASTPLVPEWAEFSGVLLLGYLEGALFGAIANHRVHDFASVPDQLQSPESKCLRRLILDQDSNCTLPTVPNPKHLYAIGEMNCPDEGLPQRSKIMSEQLLWHLRELGSIKVLDRVVSNKSMQEILLSQSGLVQNDRLTLTEQALRTPDHWIYGSCDSSRTWTVQTDSNQFFSLQLGSEDELDDNIQQMAYKLSGKSPDLIDAQHLRNRILRRSFDFGILGRAMPLQQRWNSYYSLNVSNVELPRREITLANIGLMARYNSAAFGIGVEAFFPQGDNSEGYGAINFEQFLDWSWGWNSRIGVSMGTLVGDSDTAYYQNYEISTGPKWRNLMNDFDIQLILGQGVWNEQNPSFKSQGNSNYLGLAMHGDTRLHSGWGFTYGFEWRHNPDEMDYHSQDTNDDLGLVLSTQQFRLGFYRKFDWD